MLQLSYLERLDLSFNSVGGTLPSEIGFALKKMILLALHHNSFSGELPTSIGQMNSLQSLQLQANQFTGGIPSEISGLTELRDIDLSDQITLGGGLTGTLPSFAKLSLLQSMDLSHNKLLSTVPSDLLATVDTNKFVKLDLSSNSLKGELPESLSRLPLINLDFSDNQITGIAGTPLNNSVLISRRDRMILNPYLTRSYLLFSQLVCVETTVRWFYVHQQPTVNQGVNHRETSFVNTAHMHSTGERHFVLEQHPQNNRFLSRKVPRALE